jgi:hypothetical protein
MSVPNIITINNKRIFASNLEMYDIKKNKLYFKFHDSFTKDVISRSREDIREDIKRILESDKKWEYIEYSYLYIKQNNGKIYRFYSDKNIRNLYNEIYDYFKYLYDPFKDNFFVPPDFGPKNKEAIELLKIIHKSYEYTNEDINNLILKIDSIFNRE